VVLQDRRAKTKGRIDELRAKLVVAEGLLTNKACVYATGSFGRLEAGDHSDLDLFIVGRRNGTRGRNGFEGSQLKRLDDIRVKADLIEATQALGIPEFDGDGRYLVHYSAHELTGTLGRPEDDASNTFTARLLLLLESHPILEQDVYTEIIDEVVAAYWGDYEKHKNDFIPAFLVNDIIRLWRTFCVNYEARTERQPEEKRIRRKVKNLKLKHSRMLTCYSALLYLSALFGEKGTVSPTDATDMAKLTPTERLELLLQEDKWGDARPAISRLLELYERFLLTTNVPEAELVSLFSDREKSREYLDEATNFGDCMFEALEAIGRGNRLHRLLLV
jgi:predicted nucleotidyltransferase